MAKQADSAVIHNKMLKRLRLPQLAFIAIVIGVVLVGFSIYRAQLERTRGYIEAHLASIGERQVAEVSNSLASLRSAMEFFGQGGQISDHFVVWQASGFSDEAQLQKIRTRLGSFETSFGHSAVALFDAEGRLRFTHRADGFMVEHEKDALSAIQQDKTQLIDFHQHGTAVGKASMLAMVVPMTQGQGDNRRVVGAMLFRINVQEKLFSQLKEWPTPGETGETLLARQQGNSIEVLFASRRSMPVPVISLAGNPKLATQRVLRGEHGLIRHAFDRNNDPVLAYGAKVPGTPWVLITRVNQEEADAPLKRLGLIAMFAFAVLTLFTGLIFFIWWRGQISQQRAQLLGKDIERGILEQRYDTLSHYSSDSILLLDDDGVVLEANQRVEDMYGYRSAELLGQSIFLLLPPECQSEYYQRRTEALDSGKAHFESEHLRKDGSRFMVEVSLYSIELHGVRHLHLTLTDINERITRERALQDSEALYRGVIETSVDGFWIIDSQGYLLEVNAAYCRRSGYSRETLLGMRADDLDVGEPRQGLVLLLEKLKQQGSGLFETQHRASDGSIWQVEINTSYAPLHGGRFFVFLRDIQRRNRADALLRTRVQLADIAEKGELDAVMQASLVAAEHFTGSRISFFHFFDADQQTLSLQIWSPDTIEHACGVDAWQQAKGLHYPVQQAGVWADCVRLRQVVIHNDYAAMPNKKGLPDGHVALLRELLVPILRDDKVIAVVGVGNKVSDYDESDVAVVEQIASMTMDLVARKRAELALKASSQHLLEAQRIARMGTWEYDVATDQARWSEQALEIMGIDPMSGPLGYREAAALCHPDDAPRFLNELERALQQGASTQMELRVVHPNGEIRPSGVLGRRS